MNVRTRSPRKLAGSRLNKHYVIVGTRLPLRDDAKAAAARRAGDCGRFAAPTTALARVERYERQTGRRSRHHFAAGTAGLPGECAADCHCGTYYDGFDTLGEASAMLDRHVARHAYDHLTPAQRRRLGKKARSVGESL